MPRQSGPPCLWRALDERDYLFNGFALAKVLRAKCLDEWCNSGLTLPKSLPKKGGGTVNRLATVYPP